LSGRFADDGHADLIGRRDELARLAAVLTESRLVTIVGPGGVGKTRVALAAAAQAATSYRDGPWIVELSGLRDPALLPNTVAGVLGLPEQDSRSALAALLEYLRERELLLILDTCEHVLDACASLAQAILADAPRVTVLATSRQQLDTAGEHIFPVGPLPVPEADSPAAVQAVLAVLAGPAADGDAVELFALRAAAAVPDFTITTENVADVIRLCRRLDGIPLAIELAAMPLRTLPLAELVERLDHRFALLSTGQPGALPPGALPRHKTLRTAIEWSYELCSPAERRLWARLSVFAGRFSLDAAEEVCAEVALERPEVVDALIGLVDKSVVLREGEQYRMLDTLREFGAERLAASGELASCRSRHIARYRAMARYFGAHFVDDDQMDRYRELREVHPNLRAAMEYALEPAGAPLDAAAGAELACSLYGYWQISGLLSEGTYWLTKVLDRFTDASPQRARALVNRGFLRSFQGNVDDTLADCETGTAMALAIGDDAVAARGFQHMMLTLTFLGRHEEAAKVSDEARARLRACGDVAGELMLLAQLGHLHQLAGRPAESVAVCSEGLALLGPDSGEQWVTTYLHVVSGFALFQMPGREADCDAALRRALHGKQELGDVIGIAYALDVLGWLSAKTGSPGQTAWLLGAAEPLWERGGSVRFSGTAIMEELHQQAAAAARSALGEAEYDARYAAGTSYVRRRLDAHAGDPLRLEVP
jgi:predicted ATPase